MNEQFFTSLNGYKVKDEYAIHTYDTVANMKLDSKLKSGMHVKTKGYYSANDGGQGEYIIVDNNTLVGDNGSIHVLTNGLRAVLIIGSYITPEQFGAYGDGTHDDLLAIQSMFDYGYKNMIMNKNYFISDSLFLSGENIKISGVGGITSDHLSNPCLLLNVWNSEISLNYINGANGIKFRATEETDHWIQYVKIKNIEFNVTDKCVECERTTNKWINELHFEDVRFNGAYGFYFMGNYQNGGYKFINCGNEICTTAFIKAYNLSTIEIVGIRNAEALNYTFMDIENECYDFNITTAAEIKLGKIILNPLVNNIGSITACICDSGQTRIGNFARCINGRFLLLPNTNKGKRLNGTNDTYDFKDNETDNLLYNNITLDYVEGGHAYSVILPLLYNNFTEEVLTINTFSSLNTLSLTIGNNTYNLSFTDGVGIYKVINFREQIYVYKIPTTLVNPS